MFPTKKFYNSVSSNEKCEPAPKGCEDIIPYTSKTNTLYKLETEEEYKNFSGAVIKSLEQCSIDPYMARWGACNMIHPRCLMGWELQLCKQNCLGMSRFKLFLAFSMYRRYWLQIILISQLALLLHLIDGVKENCQGEARDHMLMLCMKLPEKDCIEGPMGNKTTCEEHEFNCGNGQCIPGLGVCDRRYQCMNGADELEW